MIFIGPVKQWLLKLGFIRADPENAAEALRADHLVTVFPGFHWGTTAMVARAVEQFGSAELKEEVLARTLSGHYGCVSATPSPKAAPTSRPVRHARCATATAGSSTAPRCSLPTHTTPPTCILITNTDPDAPKHQSLTMFLVPLDTPGVEIQPLRTVDGDRTNITYYSDVRVDDKYRIGEVNGGWTVLREALNDEHGTVEREAHGLQKLSAMAEHLTLFAEAVDGIAAIAGDDESVKYRLGRSIARMEAAMSTPEMFGRVAIAQTMRDLSPDLMDVPEPHRACPAVRVESSRWRRRAHVPAGGSDRHLRGNARGVPQHDRPARARASARPNYSRRPQRP